MFANIVVNFAAFQALPPFEFKLMAAVLRYVNRQGECCPTLHQLADDVLVSVPTVSRGMARLERHGCFTRARQGNGRYLYRVAEPFLARRIRKPELPRPRRNSAMGESILATDSHVAAEQPRFSHGATQEVTSKGSDEPSEGAAPPQDEIPDGWKDAATAERRLAGLPDVDYRLEWRKLIAYSEGQPITIWRWRGWVLKARGDRSHPWVTSAFASNTQAASPMGDSLPGDDEQQRHAQGWVRDGFWLRNGAWGPAPDHPDCALPPALIAWCTAARAARAAA